MQQKAQTLLSRYLCRKGIQFEKYVCFDRIPYYVRNNYGVVPLMHSVEIVHRDGKPFNKIGGRRRRNKNSDEFVKLRPYRRTHQQQLEHAFRLLDANFGLLEKHSRFSESPQHHVRPTVPDFPVECRSSESFECGNWSRYPLIWMIYLAALRPESFCDTDHIIDLDVRKKAEKYTNTRAAEVALDRYRSRVYSIIHGGMYLKV